MSISRPPKKKDKVEEDVAEPDPFPFADLPDLVITRIISRLSYWNRQKMRLSQRLVQIEKSTKQLRIVMEKVHIKIFDSHFSVIIGHRREKFISPSDTEAFITFMLRFLPILSLDTLMVTVYPNSLMTNIDLRLLDAILSTKANTIGIIPDYRYSQSSPVDAPTQLDVDPSDLIPFGKMAKNVIIRITMGGLTAQNLCDIREKMMRREVRSEWVSVKCNYMEEAFMEKCFGVRIEEGPIGHGLKGLDPELTIYWKRSDGVREYLHYEGEWETKISEEKCCFRKVDTLENLLEYKVLKIIRR